jgi:nitric oxide dioxygenase
MDIRQMKSVQQSFAQVLPLSDVTADRFYARLFEIEPELRGMFPQDMTVQKQKFMSMLNTAVDSLDRLDNLVPTIQALGIRHATYGVTVEQYDTVREALMWALQQSLGDAFTPEVKAAWIAVFTLLANTMQQAAENTAER